ncbi:clumping factor A-like [Planococcus citri]|uniref:clumping factor A-like n=1 Tax=Planococcus citri TaxID=170843 RepID=UPI0031F83BC0
MALRSAKSANLLKNQTNNVEQKSKKLFSWRSDQKLSKPSDSDPNHSLNTETKSKSVQDISKKEPTQDNTVRLRIARRNDRETEQLKLTDSKEKPIDPLNHEIPATLTIEKDENSKTTEKFISQPSLEQQGQNIARTILPPSGNEPFSKKKRKRLKYQPISSADIDSSDADSESEWSNQELIKNPSVESAFGNHISSYDSDSDTRLFDEALNDFSLGNQSNDESDEYQTSDETPKNRENSNLDHLKEEKRHRVNPIFGNYEPVRPPDHTSSDNHVSDESDNNIPSDYDSDIYDAVYNYTKCISDDSENDNSFQKFCSSDQQSEVGFY